MVSIARGGLQCARMEDRITVVCALVVKDRRVLVAQRGPRSALAGSWEFPGGKVEPGEDWESALIREMEEELSVRIEVTPGPPVASSTWDYDHARVRLIGLRARVVCGTPRALDHAALRWVTSAELKVIPLLPADQPIAAALTHAFLQETSGR